MPYKNKTGFFKVIGSKKNRFRTIRVFLYTFWKLCCLKIHTKFYFSNSKRIKIITFIICVNKNPARYT
jgi:hypothetical protein